MKLREGERRKEEKRGGKGEGEQQGRGYEEACVGGSQFVGKKSVIMKVIVARNGQSYAARECCSEDDSFPTS